MEYSLSSGGGWWNSSIYSGPEGSEDIKYSVEVYILSHWQKVVWLMAFYLLTSLGMYFVARERKFGKIDKALLVIAHPDDECMFFGPTILRLVKDSSQVYLLCLSYGDYSGLGHLRKGELYNSCSILGIPNSNITLIRFSGMPDNPDVRWDAEKVAKLVLKQIETYQIDTVISFDSYGVSYHENHVSIYSGLKRLAWARRFPDYCSVYLLTTVNILRKYSLFFDLLLSYLISSYVYFISPKEHSIVAEAMSQHASQYVWFRKLFILFSRYAYINTYRPLVRR